MARRQQCEAALVSDCKQTAGSTHSQALLRTAWHFLDDQLHWSSRTKSPELPARRQDRDDPARETKVRADMTGPTRAKDPPAFPAKAAPSPARVPICPPLLLPSVFRLETESSYADQAGLKHVKLLLPRPVTAEDGCAHIWLGVHTSGQGFFCPSVFASFWFFWFTCFKTGSGSIALAVLKLVARSLLQLLELGQ